MQQQNKHAIISSMIILDNENNVKNNGTINNIAPHNINHLDMQSYTY